LRAAINALLMPILMLLSLLRSAKDAFSAGWGRHYLMTLPVQLVGQFGWCLGEAIVQARSAIFGVRSPSRRRIAT